jgi:hypothetical protein
MLRYWMVLRRHDVRRDNSQCDLWAPQPFGPGHDPVPAATRPQPVGGHRDSVGKDVQHVWQDHGPAARQ